MSKHRGKKRNNYIYARDKIMHNLNVLFVPGTKKIDAERYQIRSYKSLENWHTEVQYNLGPSGEILTNAGGYSILDISRPTPKDIGKRIFEAYKVSLGHYKNMIGSDYNFVGTSIISYKSETNDKIICHNITIFSKN